MFDKAEECAEIAERIALAIHGWSYDPDNGVGPEFTVREPLTEPRVTEGIIRVEDEPSGSFVIETGDGRTFTVVVLPHQP